MYMLVNGIAVFIKIHSTFTFIQRVFESEIWRFGLFGVYEKQKKSQRNSEKVKRGTVGWKQLVYIYGRS